MTQATQAQKPQFEKILSEKIPTFDLRDFAKNKPDFAQAVGTGFQKYGFAGFSGHGVSDEVMANAFAVMKKFYALPDDVKKQYHVKGIGGARGYTPFGTENAKGSKTADLKEFLHFGPEFDSDTLAKYNLHENVWPTEIAELRPATEALYTGLMNTGRTVLSALALFLELPENYFDSVIKYGPSILRPIHYPPIQDLETPAMRAGAHEDINLITLLIGSNEPGLEVLSTSGEWVPITSIEGTIMCNIGDMLQRLCNHVLPSTTHRVTNPPGQHRLQPRYSVPLFIHPESSYVIKTLPNCVTPDNPNRYPDAITAGEYLYERLVEIGLIKPEAEGDSFLKQVGARRN